MHTAQLPESWISALEAITAGEWACVRADRLRGQAATLRYLAGAVPMAVALAERWESPEGELWTLTPLGAERMEVVIDERAEGTPVWVEPAKATVEVRLPGSPGERRLARPDLVRAPASAAPDPEAEARVAEAAGLIRAFEADPQAEGAVELLVRAESIVEGCRAEMERRYVFAGGRPLLLKGRLIPRDDRMRRGRAG